MSGGLTADTLRGGAAARRAKPTEVNIAKIIRMTDFVLACILLPPKKSPFYKQMKHLIFFEISIHICSCQYFWGIRIHFFVFEPPH
jgi:hypothetical protein